MVILSGFAVFVAVFVAFFGTKTYLQEFKANGLAR
jgi:hypothetical protein